MKSVLQQLGRYKRDTLLCICMAALEVVMEILLPFVTSIIIDRGLEAGDMSQVYRYGALMVVMAFFSLIFGALAGRFAASSASGLAANLRQAIYNNIQTFSFSNIDKFSVPGLVTRMTTDVTKDVYKRQDDGQGEQPHLGDFGKVQPEAQQEIGRASCRERV